MHLLALLTLAFMSGWVIPLQTAANSNLKRQLSSPLLASFINCSVGSIVLTILIFVTGESFYRSPEYLLSLDWWLYLSGPLGAVILIVAILLSSRLGMVGTSLSTMTGMMVSGLIFDACGFFELPVHPLDGTRLMGLLLMLVGLMVALNVAGHLKKHEGKLSISTLAWFLVGCASGTLLTSQGAMNAIFRVKLDSVLLCAWISMVMTALIVVVIATAIGHSPLRLKRIEVKGRYWIFIGGLMGATNIIANAIFVPLIGAGTMMTLCVAGQLCCSMLMDHIGMWELNVRRITLHQVVGLVLIMVAVGIIRLG